MNAQDVIKILRESGALLDGHFELRSGLHSREFFQCALVLRQPETAERLCRELVSRIRAALGSAMAVDGVIAPAMGGIIVGHELARVLNVPFIFAEKQEGALVLRRGFRIGRGERFFVAEDVITRGGRVGETIRIVESGGGTVAGVAVLVDRSGGKARFDCPLFGLLEMEPETFAPGMCPLCAEGKPLAHPGS